MYVHFVYYYFNASYLLITCDILGVLPFFLVEKVKEMFLSMSLF